MPRRPKRYTQKIRNVKLVHDNDEDYCAYIDNIKLSNLHLRPKNLRSYSDIVAYPLELTVREWAKQSGAVLTERIISYEVLQRNNRYEKRFKEIDLVYLIGNKYYLVEVKVSSSNKAVPTASKQLRNSFSILSNADFDLELMIVHINLNYKNVETTLHLFNENFLETKYTELNHGGFSYNYIQLEPHGIFDWGFRKGIIKFDNLLPLAIEEADNLYEKRLKRQELSQKQIPQSEWPDELRSDVAVDDDDNNFVSFGEDASSNDLADKLRAAFEEKLRKIDD